MTSKNLTVNKIENNLVAGYNYAGDKIIVIPPSLSDFTVQQSFTPPSLLQPGAITRLDWNIPSDDANINEMYLGFNAVNLDGTLSMIVKNPFLLFQEIKVSLNNQELFYLQNMEQIYTHVGDYFRGLTYNEFIAMQQRLYFSQSGISTWTNGETIAAGGTCTFYLPFTTIIAPFLKNISRSDGVSRLSFDIKFAANLGTSATNGRFIQSSTSNNCYTSATARFDNVSLYIHSTKHSLPSLRNINAQNIFAIPCYEDKMYSIPWNTGSDTQKISLSNDFSSHDMCTHVAIYLYDPARVTAYNDGDCVKTFSGADTIGFQLRYNAKDILKMTDVTDLNKRVNYHHHVHNRRYGKPINHNLLTANAGNEGLFYIPLTSIDLSGFEHAVYNEDTHIAGINNSSNGSLDLIVNNAVSGGTFSTGVYLYVVLCYTKIGKLDKSGRLIWMTK